MPPIAREVRDYIAGHPSVSDALKMGIVNYSALARKISKELGIRQKEAVLAACRRYPVEKLRGYSGDAGPRGDRCDQPRDDREDAGPPRLPLWGARVPRHQHRGRDVGVHGYDFSP